VEIFHVPRPARKQSLRRPRLRRGYAAKGGMPGAFCTGIVKNQQGSEAEVLQIEARAEFALPNFPQSRERSRKFKTQTSEFLTIP
jgi:hypothetical protein